ncbi:hypothetical protein [Merismopedia glauca]|uniref:hypothetical protein n=1 Tax=Merismopedia glauca TaxID=292586 RepID=UPI0011B25D4B|nr:hypothetical protein [Merismopedia glauca]
MSRSSYVAMQKKGIDRYFLPYTPHPTPYTLHPAYISTIIVTRQAIQTLWKSKTLDFCQM